ncbi:MAG: endonuclease MutS2, partial [Clostridia bacterium]|nr:endonuclease MutS2 [Clostridia bacterium]
AQEVKEKKVKLEKKLADLEKEKADILIRANREARDVLRQARNHAKKLLEDLKASGESKSAKTLIRAKEAVREELRNAEKDLIREAQKLRYSPPEGIKPDTLKPGDEVLVSKYNQEGIVISEPNEQGEVLLQVGAFKLNVSTSDLTVRTGTKDETEKDAQEPKKYSGSITSKSGTISPEIDLRGLTIEEATLKADKYLDDAFLAGLGEVLLIHGKGTGSLRRGLGEFLKTHAQVKSYRVGRMGEGGLGVTFVSLGG